MKWQIRVGRFVAVTLLASTALLAAAGAPAIDKVAAPTAYPGPGVFDVTIAVTLVCSTPGARVHYTIDGAAPTPSSPWFDPYRLIPVGPATPGVRGVREGRTVRAFAVKDGMGDSDPATFTYTVATRDATEYLTRELYPGVRMIVDYAGDKTYLVTGARRALLIDTGEGRGDLRAYVTSLTGGLPLDVVITHAHPDHFGGVGPFLGHDAVYMPAADRPLLQTIARAASMDVDPSALRDVAEGATFDLGGRSLRVYALPGHTPGSIVLLDEGHGYLFSGDAVGSNRPAIPDSLWMQMPGMSPIDEYLSALQVFRGKVRGRIRAVLTGHNDAALQGEAYLDNLQRAAQTLVDEGAFVLVPSLRPTDAWQVVVGDRLADPDWAAINVNKDRCLSTAPERIASLSNLELSGGALSEAFEPGQHAYATAVEAGVSSLGITPTATSRRCRSVTVNGAVVASGSRHAARLAPGANTLVIVVTAPDGSTTSTYTLTVNRKG